MKAILVPLVLFGLTRVSLADEVFENTQLVQDVKNEEIINVELLQEEQVNLESAEDAEKQEIFEITSTQSREEIQFYDYDGKKYPNRENLEIKQLKGNNMLVSFNFEANRTAKLYPEPNEIEYYDVFPKALGTMLKYTNTRELHIRFGHGWYDSEVNGKLIENGFLSGGTGVEIWATIESESKNEAFESWIELANSLSGMFCASLNFIDSSITTTPEKLFKNEIDIQSQVELQGNLFRFRSALPREPVCTENLTPFLKLLPTKGKQGIASLLSGNKMFNAEWSSMSIDVITNCEDGNSNKCKQTMKQSINLILNLPKILDKNENPIPKPTPGEFLRCDESRIHDVFNCFPLPPSTEYSFSFNDLFGKSIEGGSLVGSEVTKVCIDVDLENWQIEILSLAPIEENYEDPKLCFELNTSAEYNIRFNTKDSSRTNKIEPPPFYASRSLSGYSQDSGGFRLDLFNPSDNSQDIIIFETLPWFVRLYMHSLTLTVTSENGETKYLTVQDEDLSLYIKEIIYNPAVDRIRPTHLELLINAPPKTKLKFSFKFDKAMLLYAEYPPDANHGFELEPAIFALIDENNKSSIKYIMRTTTSLLTLPTPDFSMPYNVIILTLTIMSLTFGSIFNLLVKKTVTEEEAEFLQKERPIEKIKAKIRGLFKREKSHEGASSGSKKTEQSIS
jgi:phosphatidylinositol glycan class T